jgi:hypothetical protein
VTTLQSTPVTLTPLLNSTEAYNSIHTCDVLHSPGLLQQLQWLLGCVLEGQGVTILPVVTQVHCLVRHKPALQAYIQHILFRRILRPGGAECGAWLTLITAAPELDKLAAYLSWARSKSQLVLLACCMFESVPVLHVVPKEASGTAWAHLCIDADLLCAAAAAGFMCHVTEGSEAVVQHAQGAKGSIQLMPCRSTKCC